MRLKIFDLIEILGDLCKVFPEAGVELLGGELPGGLLGAGGGDALVRAEARAHREVAPVRRARGGRRLVLRARQAVLLAQLLQQRHVAARVGRRARRHLRHPSTLRCGFFRPTLINKLRDEFLTFNASHSFYPPHYTLA